MRAQAATALLSTPHGVVIAQCYAAHTANAVSRRSVHSVLAHVVYSTHKYCKRCCEQHVGASTQHIVSRQYHSPKRECTKETRASPWCTSSQVL
eukprot:11801-Heterococcus_DN1.PRE.2